MRYFLSIIFLWALVACTSEQEEKTTDLKPQDTTTVSRPVTSTVSNDLTKKNLKGKIKSREVLVYTAKIKDGYVTNGELEGAVEIVYDEHGNKLSLTSYDNNKDLLHTWKHHYNASHNLAESNYSDATVNRKLVYTYTNTNQPSICKEYVNDKEVKNTSYTYDNRGNEIEVKDVFMESKGQSKSEHLYDKNGRRRETKIYNEKNDLQLKQLYTYNEAGQEIQQAIFTGDNAPSYKRKFEYDKMGNKIKDLAFDGKGVINASDSYSYKYEYDNKGNWTVRIRYDYNDVANEFTEQKISYNE
ncbi:hypothetical protein [Aureispira anguillae]|uniref:YD repeat-containing protein n=1 Tax=Aureispira anguillae TaxID=2864201 RepID=A0A915YE13_9BACT|nr:hypothetical protein [Aureispira anguillae]BDS11332.1 hypothetical protein AsAng_0020440 [Aureispira anguillae]